MGLRQLYLCRHGATAWSKTRRHTGWSDIPLLPEGEEEARALRLILQHITFQKVYTSPLIRASRTAALAGFPDAMQVDALKEWNYGQFEGITTAEIQLHSRNWNVFDDGAPGGESPEEVMVRAKTFLDFLIAEGQETVLLFSSAHILRVLAVAWLHLPVATAKHFVLSTGSVSILGFEHEHRAIQQWNYGFCSQSR